MRTFKQPWPSALAYRGFTAIELMVSIAVFAILVSLAVSNFRPQIQRERSQRAADAFLRQVGNARTLAAQRGTRVQFDYRGKDPSSKLITSGWAGGCTGDDDVWATSIEDPAATGGRTVLACLSRIDFNSRYSSPAMTITGATQIVYLPTGIANNSKVEVEFTQDSQKTTIVIEAGGTAHVKK